MNERKSEEMMKERITYVDLGAGIMILWVLLFHALGKHFTLELYSLVSKLTSFILRYYSYAINNRLVNFLDGAIIISC